MYCVLYFSQNYNCKYHREIQSVHFGASKNQISLQTGAFYYLDENEEVKIISFCLTSDCLRHDTSAVWALMLPVWKHI